MPVTEPARNAIERPFARPSEAACAVRTLALTEISIPAKPAAPDSTAPIRKPTAAVQLIRKPTSSRMTTPTMAMVVYCRRRYAWAPSWIAAAISCMRSLPGEARSSAADCAAP